MLSSYNAIDPLANLATDVPRLQRLVEPRPQPETPEGYLRALAHQAAILEARVYLGDPEATHDRAELIDDLAAIALAHGEPYELTTSAAVSMFSALVIMDLSVTS